MTSHTTKTNLESCYIALLPYLIAVICPPLAILLNGEFTLMERILLTILDSALACFWFPFGVLFSVASVYYSRANSYSITF